MRLRQDFLQRKFGGRILHMGVDTEVFRPQSAAEVGQLRQSLSLANCRLIVFGGVVRPHKGVESILEALCWMGDPTLRLLVVGPETEHVLALKAEPRYGRYLCCTGAVAKEKMPTYLDLADLIVLPLVDNLLAQSQVPCKVFEAMAMAKPVIASRVSDLPLILDGCGMVVPAGDGQAMASAIREVLSSPEKAREMGRAARERCIQFYSREVTERTLVDIVKKLL